MTLFFIKPVLVGLFSLLVYIFILGRFARVALPGRLILAEKGSDYVANLNHPRKDRDNVEFFLNHAFDPKIMIFGSLVTPYLFARMIYKRLLKIIGKQKSIPYTSSDQQAAELFGRFLVSTFVANPLFGFIVLIEAVIGFFFIVIISSSGYTKIFANLVINDANDLIHRSSKHSAA